MLQRGFRSACLAFILFLSACGYHEVSPDAVGIVPAAYTLRANDQVRVQVYNEPTITGDYFVDGAGFVSVPLAGRVKAAGRTPGQLEKALTDKLNSGLLKDARVNVQVSAYSAFYIRGEVKKPGDFPYRPGLTVGDAVAMAGGYTYRADEAKVFVRPAGAPGEIIHPLNSEVPVSPGDNIRIPERYF